MTTEISQWDSIAMLIDAHTGWLIASAICIFSALIIRTFKSLGHEQ